MSDQTGIPLEHWPVRGAAAGGRSSPSPAAEPQPSGGEPLAFELSSPGRVGFSLPRLDVPEVPLSDLIPESMLRGSPPRLPEMAENEVVRHFVALSRRNHGIDSGFYPLGSCTMKYNPKVNEDVARLAGLARIHPLQPPEQVQGALQLLWELERDLAEITGMDRMTLQPAAGAHGELTGLLMIRAYFEHRGDRRGKVLVPDSAHGTNPATATMAGYRVVVIPSDARGGVDVGLLRREMDEGVAALMLTNPSTLGLFEDQILEIAEIVHGKGGKLYYDGANMNAILGITRPGDMGFDVVHLNLHKTFSTPHGGGGPGAGPVGVKAELAPFLPIPTVERIGAPARGPAGNGSALSGSPAGGGPTWHAIPDGGGVRFTWDFDRPLSIGKVRSFWGNFGILVRAYTYIRSLGPDGLRRISEQAVVNANYLLARLKGALEAPYDRQCMHEFVLSAKKLRQETGVRTLDLAKGLLDRGFHPPTVYFPLVVEEALMIEPTESESRQTLDAFAEALLELVQLARDDAQVLHAAPVTTVVGRLDEALAARKPDLRWQPETN